MQTQYNSPISVINIPSWGLSLRLREPNVQIRACAEHPPSSRQHYNSYSIVRIDERIYMYQALHHSSGEGIVIAWSVKRDLYHGCDLGS